MRAWTCGWTGPASRASWKSTRTPAWRRTPASWPPRRRRASARGRWCAGFWRTPSVAERPADLRLRRQLAAGDRAPIETLIRATAFFNPEEIAVALELVDDRLANGEASHYRFVVAESDGRVAGFACWGPIPGTVAAADLYWIVVHPELQGKRIGAVLLQAAEEWMASAGRTRVYVETSTRAQYLPTRAFYAACGYQQIAELTDFYGPGDGKAVLVKVLGAESEPTPLY